MRFHLLGIPHTVTNKDYLACAFTQKVWKFGKMMTQRGHETFHYGHTDSDLECSEHISVIGPKEHEKAYGSYDWRQHFFKFTLDDYAYQSYLEHVIPELLKRLQDDDFVLAFFGYGHRQVCNELRRQTNKKIYIVEPGIGYNWTFSDFRVWESYALMHSVLSSEREACAEGDQWKNVVIPNYFEAEDFHFSPADKEDYFLFVGRVYSGKGVEIAVNTTEAMGAKLIVAGQGSLLDMYPTIPDHVECIGYVGVTQRKQLMSRAKAAFVPSLYLEPFGGVQIEMLFSGTPTITTDWGAFSENNIHGLTGYRCHNREEFLWAAKHIDRINPHTCRDWAMNNFTLECIAPKYEEYFQSILDAQEGSHSLACRGLKVPKRDYTPLMSAGVS